MALKKIETTGIFCLSQGKSAGQAITGFILQFPRETLSSKKAIWKKKVRKFVDALMRTSAFIKIGLTAFQPVPALLH